MEKANFFKEYLKSSDEETFEKLFQNENLIIERIVSSGQITPEEEWYDQEWDEWVILLKGKAELLFEENERIELSTGDFLHIPAHKKHRVIFTDKKMDSIWLAIHFKS